MLELPLAILAVLVGIGIALYLWKTRKPQLRSQGKPQSSEESVYDFPNGCRLYTRSRVTRIDDQRAVLDGCVTIDMYGNMTATGASNVTKFRLTNADGGIISARQ